MTGLLPGLTPPKRPRRSFKHKGLAGARLFLRRRGIAVRPIRFGNPHVMRYMIAGYHGAALPTQLMGIARLHGWEPGR